MATLSDIVRVAYEIHWLCHMSKSQVEQWIRSMEGIEYVYEYRTNYKTKQTWVYKKYALANMSDLEIKRCLNSLRIATENMPRNKAITKLKTVIDLYEGNFKW